MSEATTEILKQRDEPKDSSDAFFWNLSKFAEACGQATSTDLATERTRTKYDAACAMARKHARRLAVLAGVTLDPQAREMINEVLR